MKSVWYLGKVGGVLISVAPSALIGTVGLWLLFSWASRAFLDVGWGTAVLAGLLATLLHWLSDLLHQFGHAWVAQRVGYPMRGIKIMHILVISLYPKDEPDLPAKIHIRRALGGPPVSLLLAIIGSILALLLRASDSLLYWLALFFAVENFFVFFLGAFMPLGFTDGSTLLKWWPKRVRKG